MRGGWVYIMTNKRFGTLYIGVTSNLAARHGSIGRGVDRNSAGGMAFACLSMQNITKAYWTPSRGKRR